MFRLKPSTFFALGALRRGMHTQETLFRLFPKLFPAGGPPKDPFQVNLRLLRREYRALQGQNHPDVMIGIANSGSGATSGSDNEDASSAINHAYTTLRNPYTRAAYIIQLHHPERIDITQDEVLKLFIASVQAGSQEHALDYKALLMTVLEAHEALEAAVSEADLGELEAENAARVEESEQRLDALLKEAPVPWAAFIIETIRLKYWVNIANGIKDWEPGKPVLLSH